MWSISIVIAILCALGNALHPANRPYPQARQLFKFDSTTTLENIAINSVDGQLVITSFEGRLYKVDPDTSVVEASLVEQFPGVTALFGIAELAPNTFAVAGGNLSDFELALGSVKIFKVSLGSPAAVEVIATIPDSKAVNGLTVLPWNPSIVLAANSANGSVYRIDTSTGVVDIALSDALLTPVDTGLVPLGVNGIRVWGSDLYFTNSARGLFGRFPIGQNGAKGGNATILFTLPASTGDVFDDFAILRERGQDFAYIATHGHSVRRIGLEDGVGSVFYGQGNSSVVEQPSSLAIARGGKKMYVVTSGFVTGPDRGGQIVEISIR